MNRIPGCSALIPNSFARPPVEYCFGTSPNHAANARPLGVGPRLTGDGIGMPTEVGEHHLLNMDLQVLSRCSRLSW
jgi:hypothetical protein